MTWAPGRALTVGTVRPGDRRASHRRRTSARVAHHSRILAQLRVGAETCGRPSFSDLRTTTNVSRSPEGVT